MLTDNSNKIFSILKNTCDSLILRKGQQKLIRKTFILKQQALKHLVQRQTITHNKLINLYQIQFSHSLQQQKYAFEIVYEHYCHTLQEFMKGQNQCWQEQQLINTFQPIIQLIQYLIKQNIKIEDVQMKNIVITENQDIKYIDNFFLQKEIKTSDILVKQNNFNQTIIYEKIAYKLFNILNPTQKNTKSWKNRLRIIKQNNLKSSYTFISQILSKSLSKGYDLIKTKKIKKNISSKKKQNIQDVINKIKKQEKNQKQFQQNYAINICNKHQGKQNKIQQ